MGGESCGGLWGPPNALRLPATLVPAIGAGLSSSPPHSEVGQDHDRTGIAENRSSGHRVDARDVALSQRLSRSSWNLWWRSPA